MVNFKEEFDEELKECGKTYEEIEWIGLIEGYEIPLNDFLDISNFEYDNGYGEVYIPLSFVIVFKDGSYLGRIEYDGSEGFEYYITPKKPKKKLFKDRTPRNRWWVINH
jgi:hypothetical protein